MKSLRIAAAFVAALAIASTPTAADAAAAPYSAFSVRSLDPTPGSLGGGDVVTVSGQNTSTAVRCLELKYNTKADGTGTVPVGLDTTSASIVLDPGFSNYWSSYAGTTTDFATNGRLRISKSTAEAPAVAATRTFTAAGFPNGTTPNVTYYAIFSTYTDAACTEANVVNRGVAAYQYTPNATVGVLVDSTLAFTIAPRGTQCGLQSASGYVIPASATSADLGRLTAGTLASGAHNMSVDTNAANGAVVLMRGGAADHNLRSGTSQPFIDSASSPVAGTATFSVSNSDTNSTNTQWKALSQTNVQVASSTTLSLAGQCVGYTAAASSITPAGPYNATVIYTAVPRF